MNTFPDTKRSLVEALRSDNAEVRARAIEIAADVYRAPIVVVSMHRWGMQETDAEDLAHDFLFAAFEKGWFTRYDASRGRFRTFVRACLVAFASTRAESAARLKRGGTAVHLSLDELNIGTNSDSELDALFDREWARSVLSASVLALRNECLSAQRESTFRVFEAHDIDGADMRVPPTYAELASRFAIPVTQVTNYLNWARRRFRGHVLETLRALTTSDAEFRSEARALLGIDVS